MLECFSHSNGASSQEFFLGYNFKIIPKKSINSATLLRWYWRFSVIDYEKKQDTDSCFTNKIFYFHQTTITILNSSTRYSQANLREGFLYTQQWRICNPQDNSTDTSNWFLSIIQSFHENMNFLAQNLTEFHKIRRLIKTILARSVTQSHKS